MRTKDVRSLVLDVLQDIPEPYSIHIIDEVFCKIEKDPGLNREYVRLCDSLGKDVVNNWGGQWIARYLGKVGEKQVPAKMSSLIRSYSVLDADASIKLSAADAREIMSDFYRANKDSLPQNVKKQRDLILSLILEGLAAEEAFSVALEGEPRKENL
jgi:hypothetical protein